MSAAMRASSAALSVELQYKHSDVICTAHVNSHTCQLSGDLRAGLGGHADAGGNSVLIAAGAE